MDGIELIEEIHTCSSCGNKYDILMYDSKSNIVQLMKEHEICYQCAYWMNELEKTNRPLEVINGNLYVFNHQMQRPANRLIGGSLGKEIYIVKPGMEICKSNNVYCRGKIPEQYIKNYPNTAYFTDVITYQKLKESKHKCLAKGCWDRYNCLRYDMSCEKEGAFNIVPKNHKAGDERCVSFINKHTFAIKSLQYDY